MTETSTAPKHARDDIEHLVYEGFAGPFTMAPPEDMPGILEHIEKEVLSKDGPFKPEANEPLNRQKDRHLDSKAVYDLAAHPAVLEKIQAVYGPDITLFASSLFIKRPRYPSFPWHADSVYWPIEPCLCLTAWIALNESTPENGCLEFIPGSHNTAAPHKLVGKSPIDELRRKMGQQVLGGWIARDKYVDKERKVQVPLKPGQFSLHNERILHQSSLNHTGTDRSGLAVRYSIPMVRIPKQYMYPEHKVILLSGEDRFGHNELADPPQ